MRYKVLQISVRCHVYHALMDIRQETGRYPNDVEPVLEKAGYSSRSQLSEEFTLHDQVVLWNVLGDPWSFSGRLLFLMYDACPATLGRQVGRFVLFTNGTVRWLEEEEFRCQIEAILASIRSGSLEGLPEAYVRALSMALPQR